MNKNLDRYGIYLNKLQESTVNTDSIMNEMANDLRTDFQSITHLEGQKFSRINEDKTITEESFQSKFKKMILVSYGYKDLQIIKQWTKLELYQRNRSKEDIELIEKKKSIYNKINSRYERILIKAFGDKCYGCNKKDRNPTTFFGTKFHFLVLDYIF